MFRRFLCALVGLFIWWQGASVASASGSVLWRAEFGSEGRPAIASDGTIYFAADSSMYCLNAGGSERWSLPLDGRVEFSASPTIGANGSVYVGTGAGILYALSSAGEIDWTFDAGGAIESSPSLGLDGVIYTVINDPVKLYAINPNGSQKWGLPVDDSSHGCAQTSTPAIGPDGTIYFGSCKTGKLYAVSPYGTIKWSFPTGGGILASPSVDADGTVYILSGDAYVYAIHPNGTKKWSFLTGSTGDGEFCSSVAIGTDGILYVNAKDTLFALHPNGLEKWHYRYREYADATPAIGSDGMIYAGIEDTLFAFSSDGILQWSLPFGDWINSDIVLDNYGVLYLSAGWQFTAINTNLSGLGNSPWPMAGHDLLNTSNSETVYIIPSCDSQHAHLCLDEAACTGAGLHWCAGQCQQDPCPVVPPTPHIQANGSDGPITISTEGDMSLSVALDCGGMSGLDADWWLGVDTPAGWYCYDIYQGAWVPGFSFLVYQGPLFDLPPSELPAFSNMPAGTCTFYFGIDTTMNGQLDGNIYYDTLVVQNDTSMGDDLAPLFGGPSDDSDGSCNFLEFTPVGTTLSCDLIDKSLEFGASEQITLLTTACGRPVTVSSVVNPVEELGWLSAIPGGGSKVILELNAGASSVLAGASYTVAVKVVAGGITDDLYVQLHVEDHGTYTNSLGMTFNLIPAGTFMMGSPEDELGRASGEIQHQVTITHSFYMQTTEVTQGQWAAVMGSNPSYYSQCGDNCPVEYVSWYDVQDFIAALNSRGEGTYRLPTEAEWEYAARAGSTTAFANGDITVTHYGFFRCGHDPNLDAIGWYCGNSGPGGKRPVAQKLPNAWGLYDMHGNVWEWVQDWYGSYPTTGITDPTGPETGSTGVIRGGYWGNPAWTCRSACRGNNMPNARINLIGFRLLRQP